LEGLAFLTKKTVGRGTKGARRSDSNIITRRCSNKPSVGEESSRHGGGGKVPSGAIGGGGRRGLEKPLPLPGGGISEGGTTDTGEGG